MSRHPRRCRGRRSTPTRRHPDSRRLPRLGLLARRPAVARGLSRKGPSGPALGRGHWLRRGRGPPDRLRRRERRPDPQTPTSTCSSTRAPRAARPRGSATRRSADRGRSRTRVSATTLSPIGSSSSADCRELRLAKRRDLGARERERARRDARVDAAGSERARGSFRRCRAYDPAGNRLFVHGGAANERGPALRRHLGARERERARSADVARPRAVRHAPDARSFASLTHDASSGRLVLFGGRDEDGAALADAHVLEGCGGCRAGLDVAPACGRGAGGPLRPHRRLRSRDSPTARLRRNHRRRGGRPQLRLLRRLAAHRARTDSGPPGVGARRRRRRTGGPLLDGRGLVGECQPAAPLRRGQQQARGTSGRPVAAGRSVGQLPLVSAGQSASSYRPAMPPTATSTSGASSRATRTARGAALPPGRSAATGRRSSTRAPTWP